MRRTVGRFLIFSGCMATCMAIPAGFAQAPITPGVEIENTSAADIVRTFAKPQAAARWGSPLAESSVPAGKTVSIKVPAETNCTYDIRMVFADGHAEDRLKVDVCGHGHIHIGAHTSGPG